MAQQLTAPGRGGRGSKRAAATNPELLQLEAEREMLQRQLAQKKLRREEAARPALPYLSELAPDELARFMDDLVDGLKSWRRYAQVLELLHEPRRFVEDVVFALAENRRDQNGRVQQTFLLQASPAARPRRPADPRPARPHRCAWLCTRPPRNARALPAPV